MQFFPFLQCGPLNLELVSQQPECLVRSIMMPLQIKREEHLRIMQVVLWVESVMAMNSFLGLRSSLRLPHQRSRKPITAKQVSEKCFPLRADTICVSRCVCRSSWKQLPHSFLLTFCCWNKGFPAF